MSARDESPVLYFSAYAALYIVWGSTYLAIRFTVETIPPFISGALRFLLAGGILVAWCMAKSSERPTPGGFGAAFKVAAIMLLGGYGGFEVARTPGYDGVLGRLWLARGGTYVLANIRGGGEFGPTWHQAAIKENRQKAYDDFAAIAEDLVRRGFTTPSQLGAMGGSNGGLLAGVMLTQRPELFGAVISEVPLLDMLRYTQLPAGASWIAEYGDPAIPEEAAYIAKYSPYQNVKPDGNYPPGSILDSEIGKELIAGGYAISLEPEKPKEEPPKKAVKKK